MNSEPQRGGNAAAVPITVVLPTHNRNDLLPRTVTSVMDCEPPTGRAVRVIVVENGGRYGAEAICAEAHGRLGKPEYRFVELTNKSAALNAILSELSDHLVVFLDDDVRVDPNLLVEYSAAAGNRREGEFYGGGLLVDYEEAPPEWLKEYLPISATGWHPSHEDYAPLGKTHFFGANSLLSPLIQRDSPIPGPFSIQWFHYKTLNRNEESGYVLPCYCPSSASPMRAAT